MPRPCDRTRSARARTSLPVLLALAGVIAAPVCGTATAHTRLNVPPRVPLAEVRPGLTGYGLTVFSGTRPDTFQVTVLGLQPGARVGGDVILVELSGHDLALTAVARGMSGSPVYLDDGRLLGAIAFGWAGALKPIAGLTPASELDRVRDRPPLTSANAAQGTSAALAAAPAPGGPAGGPDAGRLLAGPPAPRDLAARLFADARAAAADQALLEDPAWPEVWPAAEDLALQLLKRPAGCGVALDGMPPAGGGLVPLALGIYASAAGSQAAAEAGAAGALAAAEPAPLVAGSACAIALVAGDGQLGALGTISLVEGEKVVLMGHPFLQFGPVDLPLAAASVVTLFPSRDMSFKLGAAGPAVGRITHDLRAGLAGVLGQRAPTVPVTVVVARGDNRRTFAFEVALQMELTPQLVMWCLYNALLAEGDDRSQQLVHYEIALAVADRSGRALAPVSLRGTTGGPGGVQALQSEWQAPLQILLANRHEPLTLTGVEAALTVEKPLRAARIVALHAPARITAGEVFVVEVELAGRHGPHWREPFTLRAPDNLQPGLMRLGAASAREFFRLDAMRAGGLFEDHSLPSTLDLLNRPRSLAELTVVMLAPEPGFTAAGSELAGLPASVRHTLAKGPQGVVRPTLAAYLLRDSRQTGILLQGDAVRDIEVRRSPTPRAEGVRP